MWAVPVTQSTGAPDHFSDTPQGPEETSMLAKPWNEAWTQTLSRLTHFLQTEQSASNHGWERKGETMEGKKRGTRHWGIPEQNSLIIVSPLWGPENPVGRMLEIPSLPTGIYHVLTLEWGAFFLWFYLISTKSPWSGYQDPCSKWHQRLRELDRLHKAIPREGQNWELKDTFLI